MSKKHVQNKKNKNLMLKIIQRFCFSINRKNELLENFLEQNRPQIFFLNEIKLVTRCVHLVLILTKEICWAISVSPIKG